MSVQLAQLSPEDVIDVSKVTPSDVLIALSLIVAGLLLARFIRRPLHSRLLEGTGLPGRTVNLLTKVASWTVIAVAVGFALPFLGAQVIPVTLIIFLVGALVVVSGKSLIENYGAGVLLQSEASFEPGDLIRTGDQQGVVLEVSSRVVVLESIDGRRIVIPNTSVLSNPLEVLTSNEVRRSQLVVGLKYGTELAAASEILREAAQESAEVVGDPPVEVFVSEFADSSINYLVWFWHASDLMTEMRATDQVALAIDGACRNNGLTIAFPQRTLWWGEPGSSDDKQVDQ